MESARFPHEYTHSFYKVVGNPWLIPTLVRYSGPLDFDSYDVFLSLTPYALGYITLALAALMSHSTKAHLSPLSQVSSLLPFDSKSLDLASLGLAPPPNLLTTR